MSKVYHGSIEEVKSPEIRQPNRSLDYGSGFYTTTSYEQAKKWVERRMKDKGVSVGYINVYELDDDVVKDMKSLFFKKPTEEWVNFVMKNRTEREFCHDYDIVYGPVADDSVYTQFTLYEGGIISMPTLIQELKTYKLVDQYLFHTEKSLQAIKFVESKKYQDMSAKITQDNLYMLLPLKIGWLAPWLSEDKGISLTEAIKRIYRSKLYKKLSTESTQYWHLGPVDLYNELKKEF